MRLLKLYQKLSMTEVKRMAEKLKKQYLKDLPKPVDFKVQNGMLSMEANGVIYEDGRKFLNVNLLSGYEGRRGFMQSRFNGSCSLPLGLTKEDWQSLMTTYNTFSKELVSKK